MLSIDAVLARHGSYISRDVWMGWGEARSALSPAPPPLFFLTSAWLDPSEAEASEYAAYAAREEQYATAIGSVLKLGFHVLLSVASRGPGSNRTRWPLVEELVAAAPELLHVHYCSEHAYFDGNAPSKGLDELLCTQEAIPALLGGCPGIDTTFGKEVYSTSISRSNIGPPTSSPPPWCPHSDAFIIRLSGRYLLAKPHILLRAAMENPSVGAIVKFGNDWAEPPPGPRVPQICAFAFAMKAPELARCYMRRLTVEDPWDGDLTPRNVRRFSIEALLAHCARLAPGGVASVEALGIVANVNNGPVTMYYRV